MAPRQDASASVGAPYAFSSCARTTRHRPRPRARRIPLIGPNPTDVAPIFATEGASRIALPCTFQNESERPADFSPTFQYASGRELGLPPTFISQNARELGAPPTFAAKLTGRAEDVSELFVRVGGRWAQRGDAARGRTSRQGICLQVRSGHEPLPAPELLASPTR